MMDENLVQEQAAFSTFNEFYDLLYHDKAYDQEAEYVHSLLQQYGNKPVELLELGSGTGNYSTYLSKAGYNITGIEKSAEMVAAAQTKAIPRFQSVVDDIATFSIDKKFDSAVSLFHVISYLTSNAEVLSCFKQVSQHLHKNAVFIFDAWYTPAVYSLIPEKRVKRIDTGKYDILRVAEPRIFYEENVVQVDYTMEIINKNDGGHKIFKEKHNMRHFSTIEIELLGALSDLTLVHSEEFLTRKKPAGDTWGVCFILKKDG